MVNNSYCKQANKHPLNFKEIGKRTVIFVLQFLKNASGAFFPSFLSKQTLAKTSPLILILKRKRKGIEWNLLTGFCDMVKDDVTRPVDVRRRKKALD